MNDLSPSAQQLVRGAAKAALPSDADRARVFEALRAQLGDAALLGQTAVAPSAGSALWVKVSALAVGLGVAVGGLLLVIPTAPPQVGASPATEPLPVVVPPAPPARTIADAAAVEPPAKAPPIAAVEPRIEPPVAATKRGSDRLAEEVALLSRATSALRGGRANDALKTLNEHQGRFPKGLLAEERRAARAQALCALGRRTEAERELASFSPSSPQAARARQLCGITP